MKGYDLHIDSGVPEIYQELYDILLKAAEEYVFPFKQHTLVFRCRKCEDVIEIKIPDINVVYFHENHIRVEFDDDSIWLSLYDNIEDIWIEKLIYLDEEQQTLFDDY